jgi:hypothetical protein
MLAGPQNRHNRLIFSGFPGRKSIHRPKATIFARRWPALFCTRPRPATWGKRSMNKTIALSLGLGLALLASRGQAQNPAPQRNDLRRDTTTGQTAATPEMWLYQQERDRYDNPREAVRRKAESRAAQRGDRLAAMKWYGQSNSRPLVSVTPYCDAYGAGWVSNSANPYQWRGGGTQSVVVRPGGGLY